MDPHPGSRGKDRKVTDTQQPQEACAVSTVSGASPPDPDPDFAPDSPSRVAPPCGTCFLSCRLLVLDSQMDSDVIGEVMCVM